MAYQTRQQLEQTHAVLHNSITLSSGMQLAQWSNQRDHVAVLSDHHTLSMYVREGYESYQKTAHGWKNGGGPGRFCLMPQAQHSEWDIRGELGFVHLYFTDAHLHDIATQTWDQDPQNIVLHEHSFGQDAHIAQLYQLFLLQADWQNPADHLQLSSASTLLLHHLIKHYGNVNWRSPHSKGGLSPHSLKRVAAYVDAHLQDALTLQDLANIACLSPYHFAHMFKQSTDLSPHQYVLKRRLEQAHTLILHSPHSLIQIAQQCGFNNASHFSRRFKQHFGILPSQLR